MNTHYNYPMKRLLFTLLASAATATAGTTTYSPKAPVFPEPAFEEAFRVSMFGSYRHSYSSNSEESDGFGAGTSLMFPIGDSPLGVVTGFEWRDGDLVSTSAALRLDLIDLDALTIYGIGGAAYTFEGAPSSYWGYDLGLGVDIHITERITAFLEYSYRWADRSPVGDSGSPRIGISYSF